MIEEKCKSTPIDIFRAENNGSVLWLGAAASVAEAKARVREIGMHAPGEYLLLDQETGNKLAIRLECSDGAPGGIGNQSGMKAQVNDEELKYPEWQKPLQEVILEFDRAKLPEKVQKVEALIFYRLQQLRQGNNGYMEKQAINDALTVLRIIQRDRLGFPDWK
jgi:hypothetical protein